jgi:hypothetical protein
MTNVSASFAGNVAVLVTLPKIAKRSTSMSAIKTIIGATAAWDTGRRLIHSQPDQLAR